MNHLATALFLIVGIINLLPVSGALSGQQLSSLYQIQGFSEDIELLLRHRAILFGIVGGILVYAAFQPAVRALGTVVGLVSMVSFCALVFSLQTSNASLVRIAWIDVVAVLALLVAYGAHMFVSGVRSQ